MHDNNTESHNITFRNHEITSMEDFDISDIIENDEIVDAQQDLADKVEICVENVRDQYELDVDEENFETLENISGQGIDNKMMFEEFLRLKNHSYMGSGTYGIILKNLKTPDNVFKISFGKSEHYNPIDSKEVPLEYCLGLLSSSPSILKPILNSFQPIKIPTFLFNQKLNNVTDRKIQFGTPAIIQQYWTRPRPFVVPMFQIPLCHDVIWTEDAFQTTVSNKFLELLKQIYDIHKEGIALLDISPSNIMVCKNEMKFIDLGFARLYGRLSQYIKSNEFRFDKFMFGTEKYRSPWAHLVTEIDPRESEFELWNLNEKLALEFMTNDFWSLAMIFAEYFCKIDETSSYDLFLNMMDDYSNQESELLDLQINELFQEKMNQIFLEIENKDSITEICPKSFQKMLQIILCVDPNKRMENVENLLSFSQNPNPDEIEKLHKFC